MIDTADYTQFWGKQNLLKYDANVVDQLSIPIEAKLFLTEIGLPRPRSHYFPLGAADPTMPAMGSSCFSEERIPLPYRQLRLLGTRVLSPSRPVRYGISEDEPGVVYAVRDSTEQDPEIFFVNSSVQQYAEFMLRLEGWLNWLDASSKQGGDSGEMEAAALLMVDLIRADKQACQLESDAGIETELGPVIAHIRMTGRF